MASVVVCKTVRRKQGAVYCRCATRGTSDPGDTGHREGSQELPPRGAGKSGLTCFLESLTWLSKEGLFYRLKSALADARRAPELCVAESPPQSDNRYFYLDGESMASFFCDFEQN
jgi:hypothetical protein